MSTELNYHEALHLVKAEPNSEERLYVSKLANRDFVATVLYIGTTDLFQRIRLSNLPERAKALIEVLP